MQGLSDVDLGPDEQELRMMSEAEATSSQQREINKMRDELIKKQAELDAFKRQVTIPRCFVPCTVKSQMTDNLHWNEYIHGHLMS